MSAHSNSRGAPVPGSDGPVRMMVSPHRVGASTGRTVTITALTSRHARKLYKIENSRTRMAREIEWATGISFEEAKKCSLDDWRVVIAALCPFDTTLPPVTEVVLTSLPPFTPLEAICYGFGIRMIPTARRRHAGETHARGTLERIFEEHGEDHVRLTLQCIRETEPNREALSSETIAAVSDVLIQRPDWTQRPSELFDAFDRINLDAERDICLERRPWPVRANLRARVYVHVEERMDGGSNSANATAEAA